MTSESYIPKALSGQELKKLIADALENAPGHSNPETFHARFDHLDRRISIDDVLQALEQDWHLAGPPVFNKEFWQWKYRIESETIDGDPITIVIAVDTAAKTFEVLTRWRT